ncbi:unnamed protein product [Ceratitis capitata]|uniref:(Mediterranean fruit fly) hypothetical protein n=1 Tax=Ceratitis capitata TaxID=7213 RepID=A0A811UX96_CERCA|nr:unnamed protein product [Ceratitis capitata]
MSPALARVEWPLSAATTATATAALAMKSVYSINRQMQSTTAQQQQQQQLQEDTAGASTSVAFMDEFLNVPLMLLANNRTFIDSRNSSGNDFAFTNFTFDESTSNKYNNESINSTQISNNTSLGFDENFELWDNVAGLSMDLNFYYTPFLTIVGGIGNILSIIVFSITKLRKLSSSFYLTALAVSDNCFLVGLFIQWLNFFNIDLYNRDYLCQFLTFLSSWTNFCSAWFVVAFTVERFIAVAFPLKRQSMCTVRHARIVILLLTLLGFMHSSPFLLWAKPIYFPKVDATVCDINSEYRVSRRNIFI